MKKALAVFLCIVMLFTTSAFAFAADDSEDYSQYPLILVPGYSSTRLVYTDENGEEQTAWNGLDLSIGEYLLEDIAEVGMGFGSLAAGNVDLIAKTVGENLLECYDKIRVDKNGESVYPLTRKYTTAEECRASNLGELQYEPEIMAHMAQYLDEGLDNVYNFNSDFRMGAIACADMLYEFVEDVLETTGAEKVNIFAVSHGGQVSGVYLSKYCVEGAPHYGVVNNAVLTVPALGGAGFAYDALNGDIKIDIAGIVNFVEFGEMLEEDYHWLLQAQILGFLDDIVEALLPYVHELMGRWGSMWDFIPLEYYEDLKAKLIDEGLVSETESAGLIAKSDEMHYTYMNSYEENFASCKTGGTKISIISGYDHPIVTGLQNDSDAIITTNDSTGAITAPYGKRFADGYVQAEDNGFYQVSPSMTVDASTCYLPENTWLIEGLYHGMTYKDTYVRELMTTLLLTDKITDVNSDPNFPQFHATKNASRDVYAAFNSSQDGYLSSDDSKLVITNLSSKYDLKIINITVEGADFKLSGLTTKILAPGESTEVKIIGEVPAVSLKNIDILVDYYMVGSVTPVGERRFNFTVMNGDPVEFDAENPIVEASAASGLDDVISSDGIDAITTVGIKPFMEIIYNIVINIVNVITELVEYCKNIGNNGSPENFV